MQIYILRKNGRRYAYCFGINSMRMGRLRKEARRLLREGQITAYSILEGRNEIEGNDSGICGDAACYIKSDARSG